MEAEYISRSEHAEFCKRVDAEDERQNKRLELGCFLTLITFF